MSCAGSRVGWRGSDPLGWPTWSAPPNNSCRLPHGSSSAAPCIVPPFALPWPLKPRPLFAMAGIIKASVAHESSPARQTVAFNFDDVTLKANEYLAKVRTEANQIIADAQR